MGSYILGKRFYGVDKNISDYNMQHTHQISGINISLFPISSPITQRYNLFIVKEWRI